MILGAMLGPVGETSFMRSMMTSDNDWNDLTTFFIRATSDTLMAGSLGR